MLQILNPFKTKEEFKKLKSEKKWVMALLFVFIPIILTAISQGMIQRKQSDLTMQLAETMGGLDETQLESVKAIQGLLTGITLVVGVLMGLLFWVLKSVVFHVLSRVMGGEKGELSSTIHLIAYTYLPLVFKGIIDLYKGMTYQTPSYEEFMREIQSPDILVSFAQFFNIFLIWALVLMIIAVREQYNLDKKKAILVVLAPYVGAWILQIALSSLGSRLGGL